MFITCLEGKRFDEDYEYKGHHGITDSKYVDFADNCQAELKQRFYTYGISREEVLYVKSIMPDKPVLENPPRSFWDI